MENLMGGYPVVIEVPVAWGEMDAFQHVNNIAFGVCITTINSGFS